MSCPACFSGFVHDGAPTGSDTTLGSLPAYLAAPPSGVSPKGVLLILTDVFGHRFVNVRLLCVPLRARC